jgi:hypothetical protein
MRTTDSNTEHGADIDFSEVVRRAHARCANRPACLECVGEVTAELMLEAEIGPAWREILACWPIEDTLEV